MVEKWVWMGVAGVIVGYATFASIHTTNTTSTSTSYVTHPAAPLSAQSKQGDAAKRIVQDQRMHFGGQGQTDFKFEEGRKLYISIKNTGKQPLQYSLTSSNGSDLEGTTSGFTKRTLQPGERHDLLFVKQEGQAEAGSDSSNKLILNVSTDDGSQGTVKTFAYITL
ncbi:hypothetical protein [Paenibacillus brasilensis]|uniref:DUF4352 domain-containing protein n=1 Tax=Paenibacillus brasilensis TaxID=128574 RepID=A0ABU0L6A4_9BACL|nr:hypothetical protein [Paenibacillus brasilensis]MDQ0496838.1 hypothetical protein [Paenibacillus brasilensis]